MAEHVKPARLAGQGHGVPPPPLNEELALVVGRAVQVPPKPGLRRFPIAVAIATVRLIVRLGRSMGFCSSATRQPHEAGVVTLRRR
jgi:hypothetical protein